MSVTVDDIKRMGKVGSQYYALATRIVAEGITPEQLLEVARYRGERSFEDIEKLTAPREFPERFVEDTADGLEDMAEKLAQIVDININESPEDYAERLQKLPSPL